MNISIKRSVMEQNVRQHKAVPDLELGHDVGYGIVSGGLYDVSLEFGGLREILVLHRLLQLELRGRRRRSDSSDWFD